MSRPLLLDLFCGAGGAAVGYHRAGFDVVGVDIVMQHEYPFEFHQADALTFPLDGFDAVHASPPCKAHTVANRVHRARALHLFDPHPDLVGPIRDRLVEWGGPYVIENVPGAPLIDPVTYCGSSFALGVRRHRLFESNVPLVAPACRHDLQPNPVGVYGNGGAWTRTAPGGGGVKVVGADAAVALGITHTTNQELLSQAIPPAYTEHLGRQIMAAIGARTSRVDVAPTPDGTRRTAAPRSAGDVGPLRTFRTAGTPGEPSGVPPCGDRVGRDDGEALLVGGPAGREADERPGDRVEATADLLEPNQVGDLADVDVAHVDHSTTNATICQPQMFDGAA